MGKSTYRPKRNNEKSHNEGRLRRHHIQEENVEMVYDDEATLITLEKQQQENDEVKKDKTIVISKEVKSKESRSIQNIKEVGNIDCDYHVFIEDYVYTYIYQLAKANANKELSAMLVGEVYKESKEAVVRGIVPVDMDKLKEETEWIDGNILDDVEADRIEYFDDQDIIGWMHLQPGYGTMLTMKEQREHGNLFEGDGSICMLVDPINKIESIFIYESEELKEQSGFCMYYERNEAMQRYMLEHSFGNITKEEMKDNVVNQFREIGKVRKAEYTQRKNLNFAVMIVSTVLIAVTALMVKVNDQKREDNKIQTVAGQNISTDTNDNNISGSEKDLDVTTNTNINNDNSVSLIESENLQNDLNQSVLEGESSDQGLDEGVKELENDIIKSDNSQNDTKENDNLQSETVQNGDTKKIDDIEKDNADIKSKEIEVQDIYVVKKGQTLANIAYDIYGDAKKSLDIAKFNNLENTNEIYYGQELKIPRID